MPGAIAVEALAYRVTPRLGIVEVTAREHLADDAVADGLAVAAESSLPKPRPLRGQQALRRAQ
eukprot:4575937-Alexandrium_andersonii.AAC.1